MPRPKLNDRKARLPPMTLSSTLVPALPGARRTDPQAYPLDQKKRPLRTLNSILCSTPE